MKMHIPAAFVLAALLSGCQTGFTTHPGKPVSAKPVASSPSSVSLQQQRLWMEGYMSDVLPLPLAAIHADSDRVTLNWNGDAVELLSSLARARGQVFSYAGVRLPLPVDIEVQGVTYANLLRIIEMQTAWRATLSQYAGQMVLQYMAVTPARGGERK